MRDRIKAYRKERSKERSKQRLLNSAIKIYSLCGDLSVSGVPGLSDEAYEIRTHLGKVNAILRKYDGDYRE